MSGRQPYDPRCSFCRVAESAGARIVHGPSGANICRGCVRIAADILGGHYVSLPPAVRRTWRTVGRWKARGLPDLEPDSAY
jgi:hypothetical protein